MGFIIKLSEQWSEYINFDKVGGGFPKIDSHLGISSKLEGVSKNSWEVVCANAISTKFKGAFIKSPRYGLEYKVWGFFCKTA
jgi:hypothetical protein